MEELVDQCKVVFAGFLLGPGTRVKGEKGCSTLPPSKTHTSPRMQVILYLQQNHAKTTFFRSPGFSMIFKMTTVFTNVTLPLLLH